MTFRELSLLPPSRYVLYQIHAGCHKLQGQWIANINISAHILTYARQAIVLSACSGRDEITFPYDTNLLHIVTLKDKVSFYVYPPQNTSNQSQ